MPPRDLKDMKLSLDLILFDYQRVYDERDKLKKRVEELEKKLSTASTGSNE